MGCFTAGATSSKTSASTWMVDHLGTVSGWSDEHTLELLASVKTVELETEEPILFLCNGKRCLCSSCTSISGTAASHCNPTKKSNSNCITSCIAIPLSLRAKMQRTRCKTLKVNQEHFGPGWNKLVQSCISGGKDPQIQDKMLEF